MKKNWRTQIIVRPSIRTIKVFGGKKKASPRGCFWTKIYKISNLKVDFFPKKKVTSQNSKIAQIYFTWSLSVPSFKKIGEPHKKYKELPGRTLRFRFVLRIMKLVCTLSKKKFPLTLHINPHEKIQCSKHNSKLS